MICCITRLENAAGYVRDPRRVFANARNVDLIAARRREAARDAAFLYWMSVQPFIEKRSAVTDSARWQGQVRQTSGSKGRNCGEGEETHVDRGTAYGFEPSVQL